MGGVQFRFPTPPPHQARITEWHPSWEARLFSDGFTKSRQPKKSSSYASTVTEQLGTEKSRESNEVLPTEGRHRAQEFSHPVLHSSKEWQPKRYKFPTKGATACEPGGVDTWEPGIHKSLDELGGVLFKKGSFMFQEVRPHESNLPG